MGRMRPNTKTRDVLNVVRECMNEATFLKIARSTGLNPSHLYRAFGTNGNPCVSTFFMVCDSLGLDVTLTPKKEGATQPSEATTPKSQQGTTYHEPVSQTDKPGETVQTPVASVQAQDVEAAAHA